MTLPSTNVTPSTNSTSEQPSFFSVPPLDDLNDEIEKTSWIKRTARKVLKVSKWILKAIAGIALFVTSPSFFAIGFVVGLIFSKKVRETIDKIIFICKKQPWIVIAAAGLGGFLALPVTLATASLFFGAYLGTSLSKCAEKSKNF